MTESFCVCSGRWLCAGQNLVGVASGPRNPKQIILKRMSGKKNNTKTIILGKLTAITCSSLFTSLVWIERKSPIDTEPRWALHRLGPVISTLPPLSKAYRSCCERLTPYLILKSLWPRAKHWNKSTEEELVETFVSIFSLWHICRADLITLITKVHYRKHEMDGMISISLGLLLSIEPSCLWILT